MTRIEQQQLYVNILYLALALIIAGVGYLKANISTIVGELYDLGDPRRDSGFTIFYMGINLGSFLSSVTVGIIGIVYGWKWGFGLAGIGMLLGLLVFVGFQGWLKGKAEPPNPALLKKSILGPINVEIACYLAGLGIIAVAMLAVMNPQLMGGIGREPPFPFKGLVQASEQAVHRLHQSRDFLRCLAVVQGVDVLRRHVADWALKL